MALGKKSGCCLKSKTVVSAADKRMEFGNVRFTRGLGRKRIVISRNEEDSSVDLTPKALSKRRCSNAADTDTDTSRLEALPQEILIRILCGVQHDDLKQLIHVSKSISEATLIAKQWHFAYSTPSKIRAFRTAVEFESSSDFDDEIEAPNAPPRRRFRSLNRKNLADISVALFTEEEQWPIKKLPIDDRDMNYNITQRAL